MAEPMTPERLAEIKAMPLNCPGCGSTNYAPMEDREAWMCVSCGMWNKEHYIKWLRSSRAALVEEVERRTHAFAELMLSMTGKQASPESIEYHIDKWAKMRAERIELDAELAAPAAPEETKP